MPDKKLRIYTPKYYLDFPFEKIVPEIRKEMLLDRGLCKYSYSSLLPL